MKMTDGLKLVFVKKLSSGFAHCVDLEQFNELCILLDKETDHLRLTPYTIFTNKEFTDLLQLDESGQLFALWLQENFSNVSKDFNKGRKLVRYLKDFVDRYGDCLPYNMSTSNIFTICLTSMFLTSDKYLNMKTTVIDSAYVWLALTYMRKYIAGLLYIDAGVTNKEEFEDFVDLFVNTSEESVLTTYSTYCRDNSNLELVAHEYH